MQKIGILNSEIAKVLADMGHTDTIVIGDCGLPVPDGVKKIDLALKLGTPRFLEVVEELAKYMEIEKIHVAAEMQSKNEECWQQMHKLFPTTNILNRPPKPLKQLYVPVKQHRLPM